MVIVALTDIHGHTGRIGSIAEEISQADWIVLAGDLTDLGGEGPASAVIEAVAEINPHILAVPGNCDRVGAASYLSLRGVNIDADARVIDGIGFVGLGGSLPCPHITPNELSEEQMHSRLAQAHAALEPATPFVLVSHEPPQNTLLDHARRGGHVGSRSVREFILQAQPILCLCGHIHEARGTDTLGRSLLLDPGPLRDGHFARIVLARHGATARVETYELADIGQAATPRW